MAGYGSDRAVSEVIGAILVFAFLVITFSIYQGVVIPQQNRAIEFDHNQAAQESMQDLRNAVRQTAATGSGASVSVALGAAYPDRTLAVNPGVSAGTLHTAPLGTITVRNVTATDAETADYFGTSTTTLGGFDSATLLFVPVYTHYREAPTTAYENTLAYNRFPGGVNLTITDQAVVDGRKLTLIALDGNVSEARQGTVTVDTQAVSTAGSAVSVTDDGGPIEVTIPTRLTAADWTEILAEELDPTGTEPDRFVTAVTQTGPDRVTIRLEPGVTYELRLAKVGVGSGATPEGPKYVVDVEGDDTSVIEDGTQRLVVEVRDRFNNPVSNVTVTAAITASANASDPNEDVSPTSATTGANGRAAFTYTAPTDVDGAQDVDVEVSFAGDGTANESVTFDVRVIDADGSGGGGGGDVEQVNPGGTGSIILDDQSTITGGGASSVTITLKNTTSDPSINLTAARISFFFNGNPGAGDADPTQVDLYSAAQGVGAGQATTLQIGEDFTQLTTEIPLNPTASDPSDTTVINLAFNENIEHHDFYVVSIKYSNGDTYTYFVSHPG